VTSRSRLLNRHRLPTRGSAEPMSFDAAFDLAEARGGTNPTQDKELRSDLGLLWNTEADANPGVVVDSSMFSFFPAPPEPAANTDNEDEGDNEKEDDDNSHLLFFGSDDDKPAVEEKKRQKAGYRPRSPGDPDFAFIRELEADLIQAAEKGELKVVQDSLARGASAEAFGPHGSTALMCAACFGHLQIVRHLVEHAKANIEARNRRVQHGFTALLSAASHGRLEVLRYLVEHAKANVAAQSRNGATALMNAACFGHVEVVCYLLDHAGADPEATDQEGRTAFIWAAYNGRFSVVKCLIERQGDIDREARDDLGWTAADHARTRGWEGVVALIENKARFEKAEKALCRDLSCLDDIHPNILTCLTERYAFFWQQRPLFVSHSSPSSSPPSPASSRIPPCNSSGDRVEKIIT